MSIITEALKKAEKEKPSTAEPAIGVRKPLLTPIAVELETARKKSRINWGPIFVVLVLVLITAPILAPVFSSPFRRASFYVPEPARPVSAASSPISVERASSASLKAQFAIEEMQRAPLLSEKAAVGIRIPNFDLSGVVYAPPDSYCILNQRVLRVGQMLGETKVVAISAQEVVLAYRGREVAVRLQGS